VLSNPNLVDHDILKKLEKIKNKLRKVFACDCSFKEKKKIIQTGKFLPILLSSLAGSVLSHYLQKYTNGEGKTEN
jgi:hypothetical protein